MSSHPSRIVLLLAGGAGTAPRTARAWLRGQPVRGHELNERLRRTAALIGVSADVEARAEFDGDAASASPSHPPAA